MKDENVHHSNVKIISIIFRDKGTEQDEHLQTCGPAGWGQSGHSGAEEHPRRAAHDPCTDAWVNVRRG